MENAEEATRRPPEVELPCLSKGLGLKGSDVEGRKRRRRDEPEEDTSEKKLRAKKLKPPVKYVSIPEIDRDEFLKDNWDLALYADPTDEVGSDERTTLVAAHDLGVEQSVAVFLHCAQEKRAWVAHFGTRDFPSWAPLSNRIWREFNGGIEGDVGVSAFYRFGEERIPKGLISRLVFVSSPSCPPEKFRRILQYFLRRFTLVIPPPPPPPPRDSSSAAPSVPAALPEGDPGTPPLEIANAEEEAPGVVVTATEPPTMEVFAVPAQGPKKSDIKNTFATVGMDAETGKMVYYIQPERGYESEEDEPIAVEPDYESSELLFDSDDDEPSRRIRENRPALFRDFTF